MSDLVIGTAGHVDHGKTSLVRALTGVDLDRLPEEKERGITIALGFTPLALPSGRIAGLVDVPGHEALVRTMVAGASGMDAAMLCVSAVEGVMPQTREHLDVLTLLGVSRGVVVQTMADLVDAELLELAADELRALLRGSFLEGAPILATSATTGAGIPELIAALDAVPSSSRSRAGAFRLPVDRSFVRKGFGTVVTGTTWSGTIQDGAEVELLPSGEKARIRGIQVHGQAAGEAHAGSRVALNLSGVDVEDVGRGLWVAAPGSMPTPRIIDVVYRQLASGPAFESGADVVVLLGTREVSGRLHLLQTDILDPGDQNFAQLHLGELLPCLPGDRYVVRRPSPAATLGGGTVLDPWARVVRAKGIEAAVAELSALTQGGALAWLRRAGVGGHSSDELLARGESPAGEVIGERYYHPEVVETFRADVQAALSTAEQAQPLSLGVARKAARMHSCRALDERAFLTFLEAEAAAGRVVFEGARVRRPGWRVVLDATQAAWCSTAILMAEKAGLEGVDALQSVPQAESLQFLMRERGDITLVAGRVYAVSVLLDLKSRIFGYFDTHVELDPAAFKELTGQSRRTAIPLLEWLDTEGVTKRVGDIRVRKG